MAFVFRTRRVVLLFSVATCIAGTAVLTSGFPLPDSRRTSNSDVMVEYVLVLMKPCSEHEVVPRNARLLDDLGNLLSKSDLEIVRASTAGRCILSASLPAITLRTGREHVLELPTGIEEREDLAAAFEFAGGVDMITLSTAVDVQAGRGGDSVTVQSHIKAQQFDQTKMSLETVDRPLIAVAATVSLPATSVFFRGTSSTGCEWFLMIKCRQLPVDLLPDEDVFR